MIHRSVPPLAAGALLLLAVVRCGSLSSASIAPSSKAVGPSGGTLSSSDGSLEIAIPAGALLGNVTLTVTPTSSPGAGDVGTVFEIGPAGTTFTTPVTMTFHYGGTNLNGHPATDLRVATFAAGAWQPLAGFAEDTRAQTVSGTTTHLSPYAMWLPTPGAAACTSVSELLATCLEPSGASCPATTCATVSASSLCGSLPGSSMQSCMVGPEMITASCCFAAGAPLCFGSVASHGACAIAGTACGDSYPGSECTNDVGGSPSACCFPSGQPVCVTQLGGAGCGPTLGGGSGDGSGGACPAPTCADSTPCGGLAGATLESCTDSPSGYQATCCFPPGVLPASPGNVVSGSSGSSGGPIPPPPVDASVPVVPDAG